MWQNACSNLLAVTSALLTGIAIKTMDDILDEEYDCVLKQPNLAQRFGRGIAVYGMLCLVIAAYLDRALALSLFCAAYVVGMGFSRDALYPTRLSGLVEGVLVSVLSVYFVGIPMTAVAFCLMTAVQLCDNWLDEGRHSLLPLIAVSLCLAVGGALDTLMTGRVMFAYALFFTLERWWQHWLQYQ